MRLLLTTTLSLLLGGPDARITHSVPVDLNFKLYGKPSCQPESDPDGGAGIFTQTIRVSGPDYSLTWSPLENRKPSALGVGVEGRRRCVSARGRR